MTDDQFERTPKSTAAGRRADRELLGQLQQLFGLLGMSTIIENCTHNPQNSKRADYGTFN
jgi:hypothetical protein